MLPNFLSKKPIRSPRPRAQRSGHRFCLSVEQLEERTLLSSGVAQTPYVLAQSSGSATPLDGPSPSGLTPTQIRHAYGFDQLALDGTGQTIAIVDAYDDPNIASDLHQFDLFYGLPDPPNFTKVSSTGSTTALPAPDSGWAVETSLDVEWAHALAPKANILLVEGNDDNNDSLYAAVRYAASQPAVSVVSMSWYTSEYATELADDSTFQGRTGVTYVAATGDSGTPSGFPAFSPYVVAVGGTTLTLKNGNYSSESAWSGSGGGISEFEPKPSFQSALPYTHRTVPDVAFDADPNSGVSLYDSYQSSFFDFNNPNPPWTTVGGTSFATPAWAAIFALTDQARAQVGLTPLDGPTQTLPALYALPSSDFHDITKGGNNVYNAAPGYDLVTGLGTPIVNYLVPDLAGSLFSANINFNNTTSQVPASFITDIGAAYPNQSNGLTFGWNANNSANAVDRNNPNAPTVQQDSFAEMQASSNPNASWMIAVPNGTYSVQIVAGDPNAFNSVYKIAVNGVLTVSGTPTSSNLWISGTATVTVTNGLLTVTNATGAQNNKIDYIDISQIPPVPAELNATAGQTQVTLTWFGSTGVGTTYNVYRGTSSGQEGATPIATGLTASSFVDTGLTDGTTYYYKVVAVNAGLASAPSSEVFAKPQIQPPASVVAAPGNQKVSLTWTAAPGAVSYNVYRGTSPGGEGATPIARGVTTTSYTDTGLTDGTTYYYQVTAVNVSGESNHSVEVSAMPVAPPSAPAGFIATPGNTEIGLSWTAPAGATSYNVYRGTTPGGEGASPVATGVTTTSFTDTGLTDGATYYYRVTAVNAGGESPESAEASATAQFLILAIDAGGGAVGSFVADTDYVGTSLTYSTSASIDTSGVFQAPPQSVYQSMRYGTSFGYDIVGLTPGASYTVRLDFVEPTLFGAGERVFNVTLNGAAFLTNFDIYVAAGDAGNKAVAEVGTATADVNGQISIGFSNIVNDPLVCAIQLLSTTPVQAPPAPSNLAATLNVGQVGQVDLNWTGITGATSYNVYRGTSPGGEGATPLATGVAGTSFLDITATPGSTYYYQVSAVNLGGEGARSSEQSTTPQGLPPHRVLAIDAGGGAVGSFVADTDFVGNTSTYSASAAIDTSAVYQAPPQAVYQSMRYGTTFSYNIVGLTPGASYTVRLHFVEPTLFGAGERVFNVTFNGAAFLSNFDIYVAAGDAGNKAVAEIGTATADANGQISIGFSNIVNDPLVCAIDVFSATPVQAPPAPTNLAAATANLGQVALSWRAVPGAISYNVYRGTTPGGEATTPLATGVTGTSFLDTQVTAGTTYYYQVSAVNLGW